jgi:SET domain-containing protein
MKQTYILIALFLFVLFIPKKTYYIGKSNIHGYGIISACNIKKDEQIDVAFTYNTELNNLIITPQFCKYINHKKDENTYLKKITRNNIDIYYIYSNKNIYIGEEITSNYDGQIIPPFIEKSKKEYT